MAECLFRQRGIFVYVYLDDWLITASSPGIFRQQIQIVSQLVTSLGWIINAEKSALVPLQQIQFPGTKLLFTEGKAVPTGERVTAKTAPARRYMRSSGLIASLTVILPQCRPPMGVIQLHLISKFSLGRKPRSAPTQVSKDAEGAPMVDSPTQAEAWTTLLASSTVFMPYYGCIQGRMGSPLGGYHVIRQVDPGYRQVPLQQAGTSYYPLDCAEAALAGQGTNSQGALRQPISGEVHQPTGGNPQQTAVSPSTQAAHLVPAPRDTAPSGTSPRGGPQDSRCSVQGRNRSTNTEEVRGTSVDRQLYRVVRQPLLNQLEKPSIDLFATRENSQLPVYGTWGQDPVAFAADAMTISWNRTLAYAFSPIALIPRVLEKLSRSRNCRMLLVALLGPRQMWFPSCCFPW